MTKSITKKSTLFYCAAAGLFFLSLAVSCKKSESVVQPAKSSKYGKLQTADIAVPASGLIAYWSLDNTGNDLSGNYNNGAVNNVTSVPDRFGEPNGAYHFNGYSSYIAVPDNQALRLANTDLP
jgi:hypothetical protein